MFKVAALYKFVPLDHLESLKYKFHKFCKENDICGTLILAHEGINGTIAGSESAMDNFYNFFFEDPRFLNTEYKVSHAHKKPFYKLKIKIKPEIVTLRKPQANPNIHVGQYLNPLEWNELISDPNTIVIDTRNDYEYQIGTFKGAINPKTKCFTELPQFISEHLNDKKSKKIAMFCTGGIRCEKSTSYLKSQGFDNVYHLKGGILSYLEKIDPSQSKWQGHCFVFDHRVAVGHNLSPTDYEMCYGCRMPISAQDRLSPLYIKGVACHHCHHSTSQEQKEKYRMRFEQQNHTISHF